MEYFEKSIGRRKFLKTGIKGGAMMAVFPVWRTIHPSSFQSKAISPNLDNSSDETYRKLLNIVQTYGGEFGDLRGGV
jgi:hypothetical protein